MESKKKLRAAVIGCGQIAWIHLSHITRFQLAELVGICDFYRPQLEKTGRAFGVKNLYTNAAEMLAAARPDVVHIVTPPPTHADLAIQAMRAACHVLVEKPMALAVGEADRMIAVARETGRSLCVDHNRLFSSPALEARRLLAAGELGELVSVDFFQGFGLPPRMKLSQFDNQWFSKLPGGLIQDLAPHCLYCLLEFLGHPVSFQVLTKRTGLLPAAPAEEVRVMMEGERVLGTGSISLSAQPFMNHLTLYGSKATARINIDNFTLIVRKNRYSHPLFNRVFGNMEEGRSILLSSARSTLRFATGKQPRYPDILELIGRFYRSIQDGEPPPVAPEQGRETVRLIQEVVRAMQGQAAEHPNQAPAFIAAKQASVRIVVTGATGFLGNALVRRLLSRGERPRALARPSMRVSGLQELGIDVVVGDAADMTTAQTALRGTELVIHCAGRLGSQGTWEEFQRDSVESTENVLRQAQAVGVKRVIYVSSLGIYGVPNNGNGITEASPCDREPDKRGSYSRAKIEAEKFVQQFAKETALPVTIFRPGIIFGRGRALPTAPLAFPSPVSTSFLVIGSGRTLLALNYIENLLDAFELAIDRQESAGRQYNIVDDEELTSGEYHRIRGQIDGTRAVFVPSFPFRLAAPGIFLVPSRFRSGKLASFSPHSLAGALKSVRFGTKAVREELGWRPNIPLAEAIKATLS
jgi:predicted dehydrogenase/nucleoside-diphosphate-sugar epimerase